MTLVRTQLFNGTPGVALDTTNTDYETFFGTSRFTSTYTREGTAAAEFYSGATATATYARFAFPETSVRYLSRYRQHVKPSATTTMYRFRRVGTTQCLLRMTSAGLWLIADSGSVAQATMTVPIVDNQPYRLEIDVVNQVITMRIFLGANIEGTTPDDQITATLTFPSGSGSGGFDDYDEGYITARASYSVIVDAIRDDDTVQPGPYTPPPVDSTPPTVDLPDPTPPGPVGFRHIEGTVTITSDAADETAMDRVELYAGGVLIGTDSITSDSVYRVRWDAGGLAPGKYTLTAKAVDASGNSTTSTPVDVLVTNTGIWLGPEQPLTNLLVDGQSRIPKVIWSPPEPAAPNLLGPDGPTLGSNWHGFPATGGWGVVGGDAAPQSTSVALSTLVAPVASDHHYAEAVWHATGASAFSGLVVRAPATLGTDLASTGVFYELVLTGANQDTLSIRKHAAGAASPVLLESAVTVGTLLDGDVLRLEARGQFLTAKLNGNVVIQTNDPDPYPTGQRNVGLYASGSGAPSVRVDGFAYGVLPDPPAVEPLPSGVSWQGTALVGYPPPWGQTDLYGGIADPANEWSLVEMDGNTIAYNNAPTISFDSDLRSNARPGNSVKIIMRGTGSTGTAHGTHRAQFRAATPYWVPTDDGNDNEVWFGFAFYLGDGYVISDLTASHFHNIWGFRHFTSTDSTFYVTIESEDGGLIMRRATETNWPDGFGSDQLFIGAVHLGWNTLVVHAKLSRTETNALREAWVNGVYGGARTTANITGTSDIRMRMGVYNWDGYSQDRTFAFDNARIGNSYAAVDPTALT